MDLRDSIDVGMNSAWKRPIENSPYAGHNLIKLAEWSRLGGFVQYDKASYVLPPDYNLATPCPVIAIVDEKIRESDLMLTITGVNADFVEDVEIQQIGTTITQHIYKPGIDEVSTTWEVPRFTRRWATFLISGLGNKVFQISNITSSLLTGECGGKVTFYGLASEGSKVLYYLGMFKIHNMIREIINAIWIAPTECPCCNGTGTWQRRICPQCLGYKYSGENASRGIAIAKGYDVRISREKFSDYPLTDAQWNMVNKFINTAWTQKWWVVPTVSEIQRMFAHFYNVPLIEILITERWHFSMPHWDVSVPYLGREGSPFNQQDKGLMEYIAESITPAGVNVFVGFYQIIEDELGLECLQIWGMEGNHIIQGQILYSALTEQDRGLYGMRWALWNGWCECVDGFEYGLSADWNTVGTVDIINGNDQGRHWARLEDVSHLETTGAYTPITPTGVVEIWVHPGEAHAKLGFYDAGWGAYVEFKNNAFYDHQGNLLRQAISHSDYHIRMDYVMDVSITGGIVGYINEIYINQELLGSNIPYLTTMWPGVEARFASEGTGFIYVDNFGANWVSGYVENDNWQRLYPWRWGANHVNCLSGVEDLFDNYWYWNLPIAGTLTGVCV